MNKYDVVIIGSGLGGLSCGYMLSKEGYNVCILEKNHQIGGCLAVFNRNGCKFDTGMHYIGSMDKGQVLHKIFTYFNIADKLKIKRLNEDCYDIFNFQEDNSEYRYANGKENFVESLSNNFPGEANNIRNYLNKLDEICNGLDLFNFREISGLQYVNTDITNVSADSVIGSFTTNRKLQQVLAGSNYLYAGEEGKAPAYLHALISNFYMNSAWRLVDGSDQIANLMAGEIKNNGGTILTNAEVTKLEVKNNLVISAHLSGSGPIEADNFISNVHPSVTMDFLNPGEIQKSFRNRLQSIENTTSTFAIYAVLHNNSFKYINSNIYFSKDYDMWNFTDYSKQQWPKGFMFQTPAATDSDEYATSLNIITYMDYATVKEWENTTVEKRGQLYKEFKHQKAEQLLDLAEQRFPGLRKHIKTYYTSTPLTMRDYTGTKDGSIYGYAKDCNHFMKSFMMPRTKIANLFLTGQNLNNHGVLGVPIGAIQTCGEFVGINYLINKINKANQ